MPSARSAIKRSESFIRRSLPPPFGLPQVSAANIFIGLVTLPEPESRYGLSLAHNDAETPLRGQRSRPAPSIPHPKPSQIRSIPSSFAPSGFEADPGRYLRPKPVSCADLKRFQGFVRPPLPFRSFRTLQIKAFSRSPPQKARLTEFEIRSLPVSLSFDRNEPHAERSRCVV
jgi:hypothetical protein